MTDFATNEQIISEKALDHVSALTARYEAGLIDELALRTGVEAIWACLGGVIETPLFNVVTQEANAYLSGVPQGVVTRLYQKGDDVMILECRDDTLHVTTAKFKHRSIKGVVSCDLAAAQVKALHEAPGNEWND